MTTDEEYLDNLLKLMEENSNIIESDNVDLDDTLLDEENPDSEAHEEISQFTSDETADTSDETADISDETMDISDETTDSSDETADSSENAAVPETEVYEEGTGEEDDWNASLNELLSAANETEQENLHHDDESDKIDVTQIIDGMDNFDEDLGEISELLKKSDNNEMIDDAAVIKENDDDDMQALLDNIKEPLPDAKGKNKKREKGSLFSRRRKKKAQTNNENAEEISESTDLSDFDEHGGNLELSDGNQGEENRISSGQDAVNEMNQEAIPEKENKTGFFRKIFDYLLKEEEEPEKGSSVDENSKILKELEEEDKAASKKKKKKDKKKKDKKSGNDSEIPADDDEQVEEDKNKKGKNKKAKKEKQKVEKVKTEKVKSGRVLSKRELTVLIAFCATIIAAVVLLSSFLPDYADKKNAREAFYIGNYKEVYQLLYDKNLNESDAVIFNRACTVLQLQSKLDAYNFYIRIGNEPEALNELLQGVIRYGELTSSDTYGASDELYNIYQSILTCLNQNYGISEEDAFEINSYDDDTYSKKVYSVVNGTEFTKPGEMQDGPKEPQDILPEEEDIIQMETVSEGA